MATSSTPAPRPGPAGRRDLADLTPDYTVSRYPDAANAVPYELYDEPTAVAKVERAAEVIGWLRSQIRA